MAKQEEVSLWLRLKDGVTQALGAIKDSFSKNMKAMKESALFFAGAFAGVISGIVGANKAFEDAQAIQAQTEKVLASTGMTAGMTAQAVNDLAVALQNKTGIDDDVIQSGENMLLTFTNVGKNAFPAATKAALDMTAAFNDGRVTQEALKGTMIQLGKALNDPTQGMAALRRVGVALTDQQQKQIKSLQASGKLYEAQKMILQELQKEFGGSSEKLATMRGAYTMAQTQVGNFMELLGEQLAPIMREIAGFISNAALKMGEFIKAHKELVLPVTAAIAVFTGLLSAISGMIALAPVLATAWVAITGPIGIAALAISGITAAILYFSNSSSDMAVRVRSVFSKLGDLFSNFGTLVKAALTFDVSGMKNALAEMKNTLQEGYDEEKKKLDEKQKEKEKANAKALQTQGDNNDAVLELDQELIDQKAEMQKIADAAKAEFDAQKFQFEQMSAADRLKFLQENLDKEKVMRELAQVDELISLGKQEDAKKRLQQLYAEAFQNYNKEHLKKVDDSWKKHWDAQIAMAIFGNKLTKEQYEALGDFYKNILTIMGKESIAAFRLMQGVAIANTLVATYESATKAFNALVGTPFIGPVIAGTAAAAAVAAGLANVDQIRRQEPPKAETGAYVARGGLAELHDQEMVLNKEQTAKLAAGGGQVINLIVNRQTLQTWINETEKEKSRMQAEGIL